MRYKIIKQLSRKVANEGTDKIKIGLIKTKHANDIAENLSNKVAKKYERVCAFMYLDHKTMLLLH